MKKYLSMSYFREVCIAVLSALIIFFGEQLGLEAVAQEVIALLGGSYVGSSALANTNPKKKFEDVARKFKSKKFRLTIFQMILTIIASKFGLGDGSMAMGILGALSNLGIGWADSKDDTIPTPEGMKKARK